VTRISEKCIFCYPAVERGIMPRCMRNCIGKIRMVGYIHRPSEADPENPMDFLVHTKRIALPLFPQFGLEPNIYYVPPINAPERFLEQMFGPGVAEAVRLYNRMREGLEPELRAVFLLCVSTDKILHRFALDGSEAVGYDGNGIEVVRVPLQEPAVVRPFLDPANAVYRHNTS